MLGASGVWLGTRFLASTEAASHSDYKRRLIEAAASDTVETTLFDEGWPDAPSRVLRNRTVKAWEAAGRPESGSRPGEGEEIGRTPEGNPVRRYSFASLLSGGQGDIDDFVIYAGESVGLVREVLPASDIVRALIEDAAQIIVQRAGHFSDRSGKG
jgi:nitronate monooxygenase